jgi:leucyl/phenylalanyl-tRNA--protein transferase
MLKWLHGRTPFPPVETAFGPNSGVDGLLAATPHLDPVRLLDAYRQGIFPWYSEGQPVLWWSPDPRMVLHTAEFKVSLSLRKTLRRVLRDPRWEVRVDADFAAVMRACAGMPRLGQDGTWITREVVAAYASLHDAGMAHSVETWLDGERVGGLYGVALGRMFYGESMFARVTDASKIALAALAGHLRRHHVEMIDCQQNTSHLASLGGREIPRAEFVAHVRRNVDAPGIAWQFDKGALADVLSHSMPGGLKRDAP